MHAKTDVDLDLWRQDTSLVAIGNRLDTTPNALLSLDFFDTLVCRLCNEPVDLFIALGHRLQEDGLLCNDFSAQQFKELRRAAEMKARQRHFWSDNTTEVTIRHIYQELHPAVISNIDAAILSELRTESIYCFVNPYVESLVHYAHAIGCQICILSDMYLNSGQLKTIAQTNGLDWSKVTLAITSCEQGTGKTSGYLYKHAMELLNIPPNRVFHLGDNIEADVNGAQKAGVAGFHYYRTNANSKYIYTVENRFQKTDSPLSGGVNAVRTLAERHVEVGDNAFVHAGCFTLGPVLTHYADWCVRECQKKKITKVLAFMREGRLLREMILKSAHAMNVDLEVEEFFVSRQAVHLASVGDATRENITERIYARTVSEMFESFGLSEAETQFPEHIARQEVKSVEMLSTLVNYLTTGRMKNVVEQRSQAARKRFVAYFNSLTDEETIAMVDVGWGGSMQRNIVRILDLESIKTECHGFYLANTIAACQVALKGTYLHGFLSSYNEHTHFMELLVRSPEIIEQAVSAPVGSTIGYTEDNSGTVIPVLADCVVDEKEQAHRAEVQKGIRIYQDLWLNIQKRNQASIARKQKDSATLPYAESLAAPCRAIVHRLINYPTQNEARSLGSFHHDDGFHSKSVTRIAPPSKIALLENDGYAKMKDSHKTFWPQGVLAIADETLVNLMACGIEYPAWKEMPGKVSSVQTLQERHTFLSENHIADVSIDAGDWLFYNVKVECPGCQAINSERLVGTYTVIRAISCVECGETWLLGYGEIDAFLSKNYPQLSGESVGPVSRKSTKIRDEINTSLSTSNDVPLLASLSNTICVNRINKLLCQELAASKDAH